MLAASPRELMNTSQQRRTIQRWLSPICLAIIVLLATFLRWHNLGLTAMESVESFSWRLAQYPSAELVQRTAADVHPPLYYLILKGWMAILGASPVALRGLSVFFSVLSVMMVYLLCLEAASREPRPAVHWSLPGFVAPQFGALLTAVHDSQVTQGRSVRMYALGIFLAALTAWLLLRALRSPRGRELWWCAYGLAVAAFCYTHYFAFFTVLAQMMFVTGLFAFNFRKQSLCEWIHPVLGALLAYTIAGLLYTPWLPVFARQVEAVRNAYGLLQPKYQEIEQVLFSWASGLDYQGRLESRLWLISVALALCWTLWRGKQSAWFFFLPAILPWILSLGLSFWSGRSIFLERYLVFGQVFYIALAAFVLSRTPDLIAGALFVVWLGWPAAWGTASALLDRPSNPPAIQEAAEFLKANYQPGDEIKVAGPHQLNGLRYYASQLGLESLNLRCPVNLFGNDIHVTHAAVLSNDDILWPGAGEQPPHRLWYALEERGGMPPAPSGMKVLLGKTFAGGGRTHYSLVLYVRDP